MKCLALANVDYARHVTDEGEQLQRGLEHAGFTLAGAGYGDGCKDVPTLLERHAPDVVFVQDARDWDPNSKGAFRKDIGFDRIEALADYEGAVVAVCKDAGSVIDYQRAFAKKIDADAVVIYYHPESVLRVSPWLSDYPLIRTYHSIDTGYAKTLPMNGRRIRGVVTGAISDVYPLRRLAFKLAPALGIDTVKHPGYGNRGCRTQAYLRMLTGYRVHVATASRYGFALRKIIESVVCGCTPVTDLPEYDVLPEIDGALVRVRTGASSLELADAIDKADSEWNYGERMEWAEKAIAYYDYRVQGLRLAIEMERMAACPAR